MEAEPIITGSKTKEGLKQSLMELKSLINEASKACLITLLVGV